MCKFSPPELKDKALADKILADCEFFTCESTFGNIFSYTAAMDVEISFTEGCMITKWHTDDGLLYCYPIGGGDRNRAVEFILRDAEKCTEPFSLFGLSEENAKEINSFFPGKFEVISRRDSFDYIYSSEDLINLKGKKYQAKRNHISFFEKNYSWSYEAITPDNIPECIAMSEKWLELCPHEDKTPLIKELKVIKKAFDNFSSLGYKGGLLRVDSEVVAYTMGEKMTDEMFCVHIEKAFSEYRGAYPMINREFVKNELSSYKYIDREDDVGQENLRKAKLSYYPVLLPEKYEARLIEC